MIYTVDSLRVMRLMKIVCLQNPQNRMILQLAPTLYHQAQAMLKFMMTFNWTHFTVVSTTDDNNFDFRTALRTLVKKNNDVNILSGQFR